MSIDLAPKIKEGHPLAVVISLLVLNLALLSIQIQDPAHMLLFKKWVLLMQAPFLNTSSSLSWTAKKIWRDYLWLHGAREENLRLQETVRQLSLEENTLKQVQQENLRLHRLVALNETTPLESIGAHAVGRTPSYLSNVLYVDRGSADGVRVDAPVLSGSGILGRVVLVSPHTSQVQLITNPDASVGVLLDRTRSPGVLRGTGGADLELNYISNTEQIDLGDIVTSSGLDGIFPKGLLVGKVAESRKGNSVFRIIRVQPAADLARIEEVSILLGASKQSQGAQDPAAGKQVRDLR